MTPEMLKKPVTEIEIAKLLNIEGMPDEGQNIIRRMAYELILLRSPQIHRDINNEHK